MPEATVRIEEPEPPEARETLVELRDDTGPGGDIVTDRETVPAKPLWLARLMVEEPEAPD